MLVSAVLLGWVDFAESGTVAESLPFRSSILGRIASGKKTKLDLQAWKGS